MSLRIAINGFGRIGRLVLRALAEKPQSAFDVVALNDLATIEDNAHLFKYDSIHGRFQNDVKVTDHSIDVGRGPIQVLAEPDPSQLPWQELGVDLVMECSGRFASRQGAQKHLDAGAKKVLISAPATDVDLTVVYGVNHNQLTPGHKIISNASCSTNCLAPVASVLSRSVGIACGYMTTIHGYTADQRLVDTTHPDKRRARAAALSMIPTSTGAARAVGLVLPELKGKLDGTAIRVPVPNVSLIDFSFTAKKDTSIEEINNLMRQAANSQMKGVLGIVEDPLVSIDFNHNPLSASFDISQTQVMGERFCRVLAWYDNEWGFANRMNDVANIISTM
ncbi:MAG: type I glyceraldehyde-3-phosphate dehydrogenase [Pseudomonadota bacterium]